MIGVRRIIRATTGALAVAVLAAAPATADQVVPDDLVVTGSGCTGLDCVDGEAFGSDTLRLKENNTRIAFTDTSVGGAPANDWELTANDSPSGGSSFLQVLDTTTGRPALRVFAGPDRHAGADRRRGSAGRSAARSPSARTPHRPRRAPRSTGSTCWARLARLPIARYRLTADPAGPGPPRARRRAVQHRVRPRLGQRRGDQRRGRRGARGGPGAGAIGGRGKPRARPGPAGPKGPRGDPGRGADRPRVQRGRRGGDHGARPAPGAAHPARSRLARRTTALGKRVGRLGEDVADARP